MLKASKRTARAHQRRPYSPGEGDQGIILPSHVLEDINNLHPGASQRSAFIPSPRDQTMGENHQLEAADTEHISETHESHELRPVFFIALEGRLPDPGPRKALYLDF